MIKCFFYGNLDLYTWSLPTQAFLGEGGNTSPLKTGWSEYDEMQLCYWLRLAFVDLDLPNP